MITSIVVGAFVLLFLAWLAFHVFAGFLGLVLKLVFLAALVGFVIGEIAYFKKNIKP